MRVQGDTGRAVGVDSEKATNALPDTDRLDRVFLHAPLDPFSRVTCRFLAYLVNGDDIGCRLGRVQDSAGHGEKTLTSNLKVSWALVSQVDCVPIELIREFDLLLRILESRQASAA